MSPRPRHLLLFALIVAGCRSGGEESGEPSGTLVSTPTPVPTAPPPAETPAVAAATPVATPPAEALGRSRGRLERGPSRSGADDSPRIARGPFLARRVRIPTDVRAGTDIVPAGTYEVKLEPGAQGPSVLLVKDGKTVGRELAVRPVRQPSRAATGSWVWIDHRDEPMVRVFTQVGTDLYFAVFPEASGR